MNQEAVDISLWKSQRHWCLGVCRYDASLVLRVEEFDVFHRDVEHLVELVEVKRLAYCHAVDTVGHDARVGRV